MPCDSITTQSIDLAKALPGLLAEALEANGWEIQTNTGQTISAYKFGARLNWVSGKGLEVQARVPSETVQEVTKAYSAQAVKWAAQRAGWTVKQTAQDQLTINRR